MYQTMQKVTLNEFLKTAVNNPNITPYSFGRDDFVGYNWQGIYKYYVGQDMPDELIVLFNRDEMAKMGQLLCGESWYHDIIYINPDDVGDDLKCPESFEWINKAITWLYETSDKNLALLDIYKARLNDLEALLDVKSTTSRTGVNSTSFKRTGNNVTNESRGGKIDRVSSDTDKAIDAPDTAYVSAEQETHVSSVNLNSHSETETPTDTTTTTETPDETQTTTETPNETNVTSDQRDTLMRRINEVQTMMRNVYDEWIREFERLFVYPPEMY